MDEPSAAPSMLPCQVCGRGPTAIISVSRNLGMVVVRRSWSYSAPLCRDHGSQLARNWLLATLLMGWWGIISFFVNFGAITTDLKALRAARRLAPARAVSVPSGFATAGSAAAIPQVPGVTLALVAAGLAVLIIIAAVDANFAPKSAGELVVGDCFDEPSTPGEISEVPHHPCFQAHTAEVFAIPAYTGAQTGTYPTDAEFQTFAQAQCGPAFDTYTGGGGGIAATVDIAFLTPTLTGWSSGDKRIVCYLVAPTGQTLSQSLRSESH